MDSTKGKGREQSTSEGEDPMNTGHKDSNQSSLISRIAASATGLTNSAFAAPNSLELHASTQAALSSSGKATSSIAGSSGSLTGAEITRTTAHQGSSHATPGFTQGFRVGHTEAHAHQAEQEFSSFLDGIASFEPSEEAITGSRSHETGVEEAFEYRWARSQPPATVLTQTQSSAAILEQESRDGQEVMAILLQPTSMSEHVDPREYENDLNQNWGLSKDQISQIRAMTREIFAPFEPHTTIPQDDPLHLVPPFEVGRIDQDLGVEDQVAHAREAHLEQWRGVLESYTDEVWGDLLPLVKQAREEVEDIKGQASNVKKPRALKRLEAILGHLRKS
ncbi:hypothetical protein BJ875DRAFT_49945 [Amylocarpus encephaloides]|uniref:Uncharacterized protein n=1 Tax=Amylocarpus encephaloides TaxID=45428 RepID=A0A9P8C4N1_9HELO|nr:hypothetical protein BJ875DRAFT_49945 [Amylocarpus encephaloides]